MSKTSEEITAEMIAVRKSFDMKVAADFKQLAAMTSAERIKGAKALVGGYARVDLNAIGPEEWPRLTSTILLLLQHCKTDEERENLDLVIGDLEQRYAKDK